jgi:hypothetical protein
VVGVCLLGNHTKKTLCVEALHMNMLVKIEDDLFEEGYKGEYDLLLPFTFIGLSINNSTTFNLTFDLQIESYPHFEIDPFPWYCIDFFKGGDVLLIKDPSIEHPWGMKMIIFFTQMKSYVFSNYTI